MQKTDIKVSINCITYNHEKYIRQALDSFLMQETNFAFEVLIHDDASTDGTQEIIREYERKYPDIIKPIYQKENQTSKGKMISWEYQYPRAKGKYIALCEGDDYWCDKHKLQQQYDALEKSEDSVFCIHIVRSVNEQGGKLEAKHPWHDQVSTKISSEEWIKMLLSHDPYQFQTSSYFFRAEIAKEYVGNIPQFIKVAKTGDLQLMRLCATKGNAIYIPEEMSCYRRNSQGSFSQRTTKNVDSYVSVIEHSIISLKEYDVFTHYQYSDLIKNACARQQLKILLAKKQIMKIFQKKYRTLFHLLNLKEKIYYIIIVQMPVVNKIYNMCRKKRKANRTHEE